MMEGMANTDMAITKIVTITIKGTDIAMGPIIDIMAGLSQ